MSKKRLKKVLEKMPFSCRKKSAKKLGQGEILVSFTYEELTGGYTAQILTIPFKILLKKLLKTFV
jgi:hypothetical protein